ncbi:MAG: helix-turn-helix domain-containing protein [Roseibium sp.]|uniref:winged helix domain-containing protein n=1 Tax=Roseibium sp. TaxID=1936156 RepID=UPI00261F0B2A|nr:helix-turn-helix domain-containing protein [Roseibium sp.]MCV0428174.1 helix-turn-helix domain-containing protein [Roseibium sp.]
MTAHLRSYPIVLLQRLDVDAKPFAVRGRDGETALRLAEYGERGLTAYDFKGGPPFRLPAYVCDLRKAGLQIRTEREKHDCGHHARYVLETPVRVLSVRWKPDSEPIQKTE